MRMPPPSLLSLLLLVAAPAAQALTPPTLLPIGQLRPGPQAQGVVFEGVVTARVEAGGSGYLVQDAGDDDPLTADALLVRGDAERVLAPGDRVRVWGELAPQAAASAKAGTAFVGRSVLEQGHTVLARAQPLPLQVLDAAPADWSALAGMRVRIAAPLTVVDNDALGKTGELGVAFGGRLWQPSEVAAPGSAEQAAIIADNARRGLRLGTLGAPTPTPTPTSTSATATATAKLPDYLGSAAAPPRAGSTVQDVEGIVGGVIDGVARLYPTAALQLTPPPEPAPPQVDGTLRIAAFNLENFFNGDGRGGGFPTLRGARTAAEFQAQLRKLVATIRPLQADVAALMELENDGYGPTSAIASLVDALNVGGGDWRFVDAGRGPGDNPIRVGLIYRASRVSPVGKPAMLEGGPFAEHSRVPLAQAFRHGSGAPFVVVANHFKSKGCGEASGADADRGDGQGCWNATRTESARRLDAWLRSDPTGTGSTSSVLLGDFNAYAMEDPLRLLRDAGWRDALQEAHVAQPYSFVYRGLSGRLDHALLSPALAARLRGAAEWHVNADLPDSDGYRERDLPGPWRSSDHDPLLLGFDL
ncbi:ExeM/NucH family extracellular endonuclease [Xanthomonas sontii]|uniref:ExeM/NucH family extracellular endonuclease n=1 Tax=Xanthomonas sontii TaxID=2650745 RepID=A0A6N7QCZ9_9XANT|nr:ExeM/NucH family extracellular endonuclease [Xanthomonas sontii]MRH01528.1 ExeM/NucH family extracellular endonuclease [Xanthomonas sontii]MRH75944.1 ExeM/NucH family extracellular endonuclease [Xanthomonas sontii]